MGLRITTKLTLSAITIAGATSPIATGRWMMLKVALIGLLIVVVSAFVFVDKTTKKQIAKIWTVPDELGRTKFKIDADENIRISRCDGRR